MFKFKIKNFPTLFIYLFALILFLSVIAARTAILNILRVPLIIVSALTHDARSVFTFKFIVNENRRLKKQLDNLKKETVIINELKLENERLKRLLSLKDKAHFITVAASVIGRDPDNWSSSIIIDKGSRQNIRIGSAVITDGGLAGKVIEVAAETSKAVLINDPNSSVAVIIQRSREEGIVSGTLLGGIIIRYLEKDADVEVGDIVLTSGLASNYPADILIGEVASVENERHGLGKRCRLKPAVNLDSLEEILVIVR